MLVPLLPLLALIASPTEAVTTPTAAQSRLVELLVSADSVDAVQTGPATTTFQIERGATSYDLVATTTDTGDVVALAMIETVRAPDQRGALSWLRTALADDGAIASLVVDHGAVTIVTTGGRYYRAIASRDPNAAVEARWAAAWDD